MGKCTSVPSETGIAKNTQKQHIDIKTDDHDEEQYEQNILSKQTTIQIFVQVIDKHNSKIFMLDVCVSDSIQDVKDILCNKCSVYILQERLATSSGRLLRDDLKLMDYNIQHESILQVHSTTNALQISRIYASGQYLSVGTKIDCFESYHWCASEITKCKYPKELIPVDELNKIQKLDVDRLMHLAAVYVKCYDEWIFIEHNTFCYCSDLCTNIDHRIAVYDTQSVRERLKQERLKKEKLKQERLKHHKQLTKESEKRKQEWNIGNLNMVSFSSQSNSCLYYNACLKIMKKYVDIYNINRSMFDLSGNKCFCKKCHGKRRDKKIYSRGKPSQVYVLPIGYVRFGIKLFSNQTEQNILNDWHVVYHGTQSKYIKEISESGLILLKPNDFKLDKNGLKYKKTNKIRSGHIQKKFIRFNKHTKQKETFDPDQIFTSPSCIYSSYYCDQISIGNKNVSFMFQ
eukprot:397442_1